MSNIEVDFYERNKALYQRKADKGLKAVLIFAAYFILMPTVVFSIIAFLIK